MSTPCGQRSDAGTSSGSHNGPSGTNLEDSSMVPLTAGPARRIGNRPDNTEECTRGGSTTSRVGYLRESL